MIIYLDLLLVSIKMFFFFLKGCLNIYLAGSYIVKYIIIPIKLGKCWF